MAILEKPKTPAPPKSRKTKQPARTLSERDAQILLAALEADTEPNEALQEAVARYRRLVVRQ